MTERREKTSIETRVSPCEICAFPLVHRHHILGFGKMGENNHAILLCANCHSLLHICINAIIFKKKRAIEVWESFCCIMGIDDEYIKKILDKTYETVELSYEFEMEYRE
jgi:hypothetical protein